MNKHSFFIIIPFHIAAIAGLFFAGQYWAWLLTFWLLFGVIGNGVAGHRYFAHGSFTVAPWLHHVLAYLTVMGAYAPPTYWVLQHAHHHRTSDNQDDIHTPAKGLWQAFYGWLFDKDYVDSILKNKLQVAKVCLRKNVAFYEQHYYKILFGSLVVLALINWHLVLIYALAYAIDVFRLGLVNAVCHRWGYRNHNTPDQSRNNIFVGILGMGFGWHNNHHARPGRLILTERWWEIDVEGYISWCLSKTASK